MLWRLDPTSSDPLYAQLVAQVQVGLARGELAAGDRLPAARELAGSLDVNVHTVLHAYQQLRDEGVLELRRGRGAVIAPNSPLISDQLHSTLAAFVGAVRDAGLSPATAVTLLKESLQ